MKPRTKAILVVAAVLVLALSLKFTRLPAEDFAMSADALRKLVDQAYRDDPRGEAALELSHFYRFDLHDAKAGLLWETVAAEKGNATALHNQKVRQEDQELRDRP